jgi:hypothetical protein
MFCLKSIRRPFRSMQVSSPHPKNTKSFAEERDARKSYSELEKVATCTYRSRNAGAK